MALFDKINPVPAAILAVGLVTTTVLVCLKHVDAAAYTGLLNVVLQAIVPQIHKTESKNDGQDSGT